ncbi:ABC transporter B family member 7, partial [Nymphaea thermarum]
MVLGVLAFLVAPIQSYLFRVSGAQHIKRIRATSFEGLTHQKISSFDDAEKLSQRADVGGLPASSLEGSTVNEIDEDDKIVREKIGNQENQKVVKDRNGKLDQLKEKLIMVFEVMQDTLEVMTYTPGYPPYKECVNPTSNEDHDKSSEKATNLAGSDAINQGIQEIEGNQEDRYKSSKT